MNHNVKNLMCSISDMCPPQGVATHRLRTASVGGFVWVTSDGVQRLLWGFLIAYESQIQSPPSPPLKSRSNGAPPGIQMVCKAPMGISRMEEDLHPESFCGVEAAGLPSGCVQPLGLQSVLRGRWQPRSDTDP